MTVSDAPTGAAAVAALERQAPIRVRFRFTKIGKVRFTSHRDVARLWERALRRAGLPVALTEGFNPRPKVHFGLALPTGYESLGEYLDVDFRPVELRERFGRPSPIGDPSSRATSPAGRSDPTDSASPFSPPGDLLVAELAGGLDLSSLPEQLTPLLPEGMTVQAAALVDPAAPSLQQAVTSCTWRIEAVGLAPSHAHAAIDRLLAADTLPVTRQRKGRPVTDDIRPYLHSVAVLGPLPASPPDAGCVLLAELGAQPRGLRPSELLVALAGDERPVALTGDDLLAAVARGVQPIEEGVVCRTQQWIASADARHEPLPVPPAASASGAPDAVGDDEEARSTVRCAS